MRLSLHPGRVGHQKVPLQEQGPFVGCIGPCDRRILGVKSLGPIRGQSAAEHTSTLTLTRRGQCCRIFFRRDYVCEVVSMHTVSLSTREVGAVADLLDPVLGDGEAVDDSYVECVGEFPADGVDTVDPFRRAEVLLFGDGHPFRDGSCRRLGGHVDELGPPLRNFLCGAVVFVLQSERRGW